MSHFQITAMMGNGATVLLGVAAEDETGALLVARDRLPAAGAQVSAIGAVRLPGRRLSGRMLR